MVWCMMCDGVDCCVLDAMLTLDSVLFCFLCRNVVWIVFIPTGIVRQSEGIRRWWWWCRSVACGRTCVTEKDKEWRCATIRTPIPCGYHLFLFYQLLTIGLTAIFKPNFMLSILRWEQILKYELFHNFKILNFIIAAGRNIPRVTLVVEFYLSEAC